MNQRLIQIQKQDRIIGHIYISVIVFSFCLFFALQPSIGICQERTVIIPMQFRNVSEVIPIVKDMISQDGKATVDMRTNSVVITDSDESIQKIRAFLERFDKPPGQVRVRVRFQEVRSSQSMSLSAEGSVSGKNWRVSTGRTRRDGVDIRLGHSNRAQRESSEYFVNVLSGSPAYIMVGQDLIYRERWGYLFRKYAGYKEKVIIQRFESGVDVSPVIVGDHANIEITPKISHEVSRGRKEIIRFTEATTTLSVPLGQWVTIGGTDEESNEVIREILEIGSGKKNSSLSISLMVEAH
ncbi:MAG: hypothetical protein JRC68_06480 [Deltaproteobacteria bacterium]|nr:hypothetical protein [Deltaproteobacteria bacterium]